MKNIETIKYSEFNRILTEEFKHKKPSEVLVQAIYESNIYQGWLNFAQDLNVSSSRRAGTT